MPRELLIGCGSSRERRITPPNGRTGWGGLTTLDNNPAHKPDVVYDLNQISVPGCLLPFEENAFDEVHAYEVLEHIGQQGDYKAFFSQFEEFYRILKPGGFFCGTCPSYKSKWAWGDPSHTRVLTSGTLAFLSQSQYEKQVGKTAMSDFRHIYKADFKTMWCQEDEESLAFILKARK